MADNKDSAVLAKKVYELSVLPMDALDARKWEALLILNAVYSSATPEGIDKANADKEARFGDAIRKEGLLSRMHPKWHLRTDDFREPWPLVLPQDNGLPPVMLLIDDQGATHDGGIYDDPADDAEWDRVSWANAVRTWNVDFLRNNQLARLYTTVESAADKVVETAGQIADGANEAARGLATILKWAPYVLAGIGAIDATAVVLAAVNKHSTHRADPRAAGGLTMANKTAILTGLAAGAALLGAVSFLGQRRTSVRAAQRPGIIPIVTPFIDIETAEGVLAAMEHLPDNRVTIVLHTLGGCITACVLIAIALRHFNDSTAVVPYLAISGGTLIALSANRLEMGDRASLSAVDPQIMGQRVKHLAENRDKPGLAALAREYDVSMRKYVRARLSGLVPADRLNPAMDLFMGEHAPHDWPIQRPEVEATGIAVSPRRPQVGRSRGRPPRAHVVIHGVPT